MDADWSSMGDAVCEILTQMYVRKRATFMRAAKERGCSMEQLAAAAITEMARERLHDPAGCEG